MTINELKELIKDLPDDMEVILQNNAVNNECSPLNTVDANCIHITDEWGGEIYFLSAHPSDYSMSMENWEELKKLDRSLLLIPLT